MNEPTHIKEILEELFQDGAIDEPLKKSIRVMVREIKLNNKIVEEGLNRLQELLDSMRGESR